MSNILDAYPPAPPPGEDELPCDDGQQSERHRRQMNLLTESLELAWEGRDDVYVGGNMAIYFSETQTRKNDFRGPDVFVVLDTVRRERKSWVVWQEDGRTPDVVIELLSPTTEDVDRGEKMRIYAKLLHVPEYYLFDPVTLVLEGYQLNPSKGRYDRIEPLPSGELPCARLGLHLGVRRSSYQGVEADWLRWIDGEGRVLVTGEERASDEARRREEAERRLADETKRREAAEQQLAAALAELQQLKKGAPG
jgi:Uma2 family endonuclease